MVVLESQSWSNHRRDWNLKPTVPLQLNSAVFSNITLFDTAQPIRIRKLFTTTLQTFIQPDDYVLQVIGWSIIRPSLYKKNRNNSLRIGVIMEDSLMGSATANQWNNTPTADVYNESVISAHHPIRYPREASYFAAACAILFVIIGIGGKSLFPPSNFFYFRGLLMCFVSTLFSSVRVCFEW